MFRRTDFLLSLIIGVLFFVNLIFNINNDLQTTNTHRDISVLNQRFANVANIDEKLKNQNIYVNKQLEDAEKRATEQIKTSQKNVEDKVKFYEQQIKMYEQRFRGLEQQLLVLKREQEKLKQQLENIQSN